MASLHDKARALARELFDIQPPKAAANPSPQEEEEDENEENEESDEDKEAYAERERNIAEAKAKYEAYRQRVEEGYRGYQEAQAQKAVEDEQAEAELEAGLGDGGSHQGVKVTQHEYSAPTLAKPLINLSAPYDPEHNGLINYRNKDIGHLMAQTEAASDYMLKTKAQARNAALTNRRYDRRSVPRYGTYDTRYPFAEQTLDSSLSPTKSTKTTLSLGLSGDE